MQVHLLANYEHQRMGAFATLICLLNQRLIWGSHNTLSHMCSRLSSDQEAAVPFQFQLLARAEPCFNHMGITLKKLLGYQARKTIHKVTMLCHDVAHTHPKETFL